MGFGEDWQVEADCMDTIPTFLETGETEHLRL